MCSGQRHRCWPQCTAVNSYGVQIVPHIIQQFILLRPQGARTAAWVAQDSSSTDRMRRCCAVRPRSNDCVKISSTPYAARVGSVDGRCAPASAGQRRTQPGQARMGSFLGANPFAPLNICAAVPPAPNPGVVCRACNACATFAMVAAWSDCGRAFSLGDLLGIVAQHLPNLLIGHIEPLVRLNRLRLQQSLGASPRHPGSLTAQQFVSKCRGVRNIRPKRLR